MTARRALYAAFFAPYHVKEPEHLVRLWGQDLKRNILQLGFSVPKYEVIRDQQTSFTALGAATQLPQTLLLHGTEPSQANGSPASRNGPSRALGASRLRIVRQFLVESLMLSGTAAALGAVFAYWTLPGLLVLAQNNLPFANDIRISLPVLGATVLLAVAAGAVIGLYPAVLGSRSDVRASAKAEGKGMPFAFSPYRRLGFLATC